MKQEDDTPKKEKIQEEKRVETAPSNKTGSNKEENLE